MVVRHDVDLEALGKMAVLPPDRSPLQLGARGSFEGAGFELIGRLRLAWKDGRWNEWFLQFDDGRTGWLGEAQGRYMLSFAQPGAAVPVLGDLYPTRRLELAGQVYQVDDIKPVVCEGSEGELPFAAPTGRRTTSVDLSGAGGIFANLEYAPGGAILYLGRHLPFEDFRFSGLRELDALPQPAPAAGPQSFSCPSCAGTVSVRAKGQSLSAACGHCGSIIDVTDENHRILSTARQKLRIEPPIPLGSRGTLRGHQWEVIGFLQRRDDEGHAWQETLLFHPTAGFRWLVDANGAWTWFEALSTPPVEEGQSARIGANRFRLHSTYQATVDYVLGEFYWRVAVGETVQVREYLLPPRSLSCELGADEVNWSLGSPLLAASIEAAFGVSLPAPASEPPAADAPGALVARLGQITPWWLFFTIVLFLIRSGGAPASAFVTALLLVWAYPVYLLLRGYGSRYARQSEIDDA